MAGEKFFSLDGMVAVVTGGAQGIGEAICRRLANAGAKVAVFDLSEEKARQTSESIAGSIPVSGDVTSEADLTRTIGEVESKLGPVSILVNCAGITGRTVPAWELKVEEFEKVMAVNVTGIFIACKAVLPGMIERKFGRIINIASVAGKEGNPTMCPYSASKAAVIGLTKSLGKEVVKNGDVTVNAISPAVIRTPILDGVAQSTIDYMVSKIPMGRTGEPEEVAALVHYLASREASFTTAQCYDISGGRSTY